MAGRHEKLAPILTALGKGRCVAYILVLTTTGLYGSPSRADPGPSGPPPGSLIYLRDVPTRQAQVPGPPGRAHWVELNTAPLLVGSLSLGLKPISDEEAGHITASIGPTIPGATSAIGNALGNSQSMGSIALRGAPGQRSIGSSVGGAIGQGTSALTNAMTNVRSALGGSR